MNHDLIKEYFLKLKGKEYKRLQGYENIYTIDRIFDYNNVKTEFIYAAESQIDKIPNGYLICYTENQSMKFSGKYFILADDIRNYQLNKILENGINNN